MFFPKAVERFWLLALCSIVGVVDSVGQPEQARPNQISWAGMWIWWDVGMGGSVKSMDKEYIRCKGTGLEESNSTFMDSLLW